MNLVSATTIETSLLNFDVIDGYFEALDPVFAVISDCENGKRDIMKELEGPVCQAGFKRLN